MKTICTVEEKYIRQLLQRYVNIKENIKLAEASMPNNESTYVFIQKETGKMWQTETCLWDFIDAFELDVATYKGDGIELLKELYASMMAD
jgi:hypothetical protein